MKKLIFGLLLIGTSAFAKPIRIGIMDSGLLVNTTHRLCDKALNVSYIPNQSWDKDDIGHGTLIANIITEKMLSTDYCFVIYRVFSESKDSNGTWGKNIKKALYKASQDKLDILNISFTGSEPDMMEGILVRGLLNQGVTIVAAAGNDKLDLKDKCTIWPACYDTRIIVVGGYKQNGYRLPVSNMMPGIQNFVMSQSEYCVEKDDCHYGTSFAAPVVAAMMANTFINRDKAVGKREQKK